MRIIARRALKEFWAVEFVGTHAQYDTVDAETV